MIKNTFAAGLTLLASTLAFGEVSPLSYTFINIGYFDAEILDEDFDGLGISGSFAVGDNIFLLGSFAQLDSEDEYGTGSGADEIEYTEFTLGAGFYLPVAELADFVATLSYADAEIEHVSASADGTGYVATVGVRAKASDTVELNAGVNYADIDGDGETGFSLSAYFYADDKIALGLSYDTADDVDTIGFNFRFDI